MKIIRFIIYDRRDSLFREYNDNYLEFRYGEDGNVIYNESDYFHVWLENCLMRHLSINNFARRIISYIFDSGAKLSAMENYYEEDELLEIINDRMDSKEAIKEYNTNKIVNSNDMNEVEVEYIQEKVINQQELLPDERYAYDRYKLRKIYNWNNEITKEFVKTYNN